MSTIAAVTTLSSLLWCYSAVMCVIWFRAVAQLERREHVAQFVGLMGVFVPGMALAIAFFLLGALLSFPELVLLLALIFPGTVALGLHLEVARLTEPEPLTEGLRVAAAVALALIWAAS